MNKASPVVAFPALLDLQCNDDSDNQFEDYKHHYKPLLVVSLICIGNTAYSEVMGRYSGEN